MTPQERYLRDPEFHTLVDLLENFIQQAKYTPTELREACILAATRYEMYRTDLRYTITAEEFATLSLHECRTHPYRRKYLQKDTDNNPWQSICVDCGCLSTKEPTV